MSTFENSEIDGVTFGGDTVDEITMDGDVVWTATTPPDLAIIGVTDKTDSTIDIEVEITTMGTYSEVYVTSAFREQGTSTWTTDSSYSTMTSTGSTVTTAGDGAGNPSLDPDTTYELRGEVYADTSFSELLDTTGTITETTDPSITIFEDFEDGQSTLDDYENSSWDPHDHYDVISAGSDFEGSYMLHGNKGSDDGPRAAINHDITFGRGTTFSYLTQINSGVTFGGAFIWAVPGSATYHGDLEGYQVRFRENLDNGRLQFYRVDNGLNDITFIEQTKDPTINHGHTYRVEIDYAPTGSAHQFRMYDHEGGGSQIASMSATEDTYGSGAICFPQIQNAEVSEYWDYLHEPAD